MTKRMSCLIFHIFLTLRENLCDLWDVHPKCLKIGDILWCQNLEIGMVYGCHNNKIMALPE